MSRALEWLRAAQNADGGWGYQPGGMSFAEPTAASLLVLASDVSSHTAVEHARAYLTTLQRADGGWGVGALDDTSGWMTAWAVWALASLDRNAAGRGADWLLATRGLELSDPAQLEWAERVLRIDARLTGWPWQPDDAAWIFPTSLALIALDAVGIRDHPRAQEGTQYLLDRAIESGGWNIGNPFMVTGTMPPTVENTVMALVALDLFHVNSEICDRAREWLNRSAFVETAFEWAWRAWYWARRGDDLGRARAALGKMQRADSSWDGNCLTTAIALLALEGAT